MKRPAVFLTVLFITIIGSTAVVSTAISGICRSFYKKDIDNSVNVKSVPADKHVNGQLQVSAKL